jgi:hypothetical protein
VSFGGSAQLVQPPTDSNDELNAAIDRFQLQRGTATGSALLVSLATLFPDEGIDVGAVVLGPSKEGSGGRGRAIDAPAAARPPPQRINSKTKTLPMAWRLRPLRLRQRRRPRTRKPWLAHANPPRRPQPVMRWEPPNPLNPWRCSPRHSIVLRRLRR